ncbi:MAG: D-aminoacyl-tRNA deacylase [Actinomycetota bacterium]|nr:D-aminoacyl-tRNA deacylase [Actinomycetota bacterium]
MRAVVQRVTNAAVVVDGDVVGAIGAGLCVLVGVRRGDDEGTATKMAERLWNLRIFADEAAHLNRSAAELDLPLLVISQFTLYGDTTKGRRPSFDAAAPGPVAEPLIERLAATLESFGATVRTGRFGASMAVSLTNDGPVTVLIET